MFNRFRQGFTLIEIIIVIVIFGVMATLALPKITGHVESARGAEAINMLGAIRRAVGDCIDSSNTTGNAAGAVLAAANCHTWKQLGMMPPEGAQFNYTSNVADPLQFKATRPSGAICLNIESFTGRAQFQVSTEAVLNPFKGIIDRINQTGGADCTAADSNTPMI